MIGTNTVKCINQYFPDISNAYKIDTLTYFGQTFSFDIFKSLSMQ